MQVSSHVRPSPDAPVSSDRSSLYHDAPLFKIFTPKGHISYSRSMQHDQCSSKVSTEYNNNKLETMADQPTMCCTSVAQTMATQPAFQDARLHFLHLDDETLPILFLLSLTKLDCILNSVHQSFQHWDGIGNSQSEILSKSLNFHDHPQFQSAGPKVEFSYSNVLTKLVFRCQISFHVDQSDQNFNKI